ncbi:MAG: TetR family transcriptional regulator [Zoogloeaceae bacterium]|jgi:TetR/AcrR family acrAB operon transcriptional repressor|nr:TetR family transcriptional regulator [Zoogloeaceae bacterium]
MARKTREDAQATRNRILDTAVELFGSQGVSRTSLNDIARHAGVTRGAIYGHFENKVDLFSAMIERLICPLMLHGNEYNEFLNHDPMGFLRAVTTEFLDKLARDQNFCQVFEILWHKCEYVGEIAALRQKYLDEGERHVNIIEQAFSLAKEKGQTDTPLTPHQATIGLVALTDGLIFNWTKDQRMFSMETYGVPILETFFRGLGVFRGQGTDLLLAASPPQTVDKPLK